MNPLVTPEPRTHPLTYADGTINPVRVYPAARGARSPIPGGAPAPMICIWPGIAVPAGYFDLLGWALAARGYNVLASEHRGVGDSRPRVTRRSTFGMNTIASEDYPAVAALGRELFPGSPITLLGHSMGGLLGTMYLARARNNLAAVMLFASGASHYKHYAPTEAGIRLVRAVGGPVVSRAIGYWPGSPFENFGAQSHAMVRDLSILNRTGNFVFPDQDVDYEKRLGANRVPVLAVWIAGDQAIPRTAVEAIAAKFPAETVTITGIREPVGHNHWIRKPELAVPIIDRFLVDKLGR